ncbi:hypothetical protein M758_4G251500 [Ceratodon purpureus]|nr:hypothetical protein M758_4G251500 [Ceratodon purpureus]
MPTATLLLIPFFAILPNPPNRCNPPRNPQSILKTTAPKPSCSNPLPKQCNNPRSSPLPPPTPPPSSTKPKTPQHSDLPPTPPNPNLQAPNLHKPPFPTHHLSKTLHKDKDSSQRRFTSHHHRMMCDLGPEIRAQ